MTTRSNPNEASGAKPWWKFKMMWLVVGGPLVVVAASFFTLSLAIRFPDPVVATSNGPVDAAHLPAMQGRNHAATGGVSTGAIK